MDDLQIQVDVNPETNIVVGDDEVTDDIYEVEKIIGVTKKKGERRYKVRWKGYPSEYDTWETESTLSSCADLIETFKEEKRRRQKERKLLQGTNGEESAVKKKPNYCYLDVDTTLKDTFWKDLEEGKVNVFATDLYSRVKATGRIVKDGKNCDKPDSQNSEGTQDSGKPNKTSKKRLKLNKSTDNKNEKCSSNVKRKVTIVKNENSGPNSMENNASFNGSFNDLQDFQLLENIKNDLLDDSRCCTFVPDNLQMKISVDNQEHNRGSAAKVRKKKDNTQINNADDKLNVSKQKKKNLKLSTKTPTIKTCSWSSVDSGITNPSPSTFSSTESPNVEDMAVESQFFRKENKPLCLSKISDNFSNKLQNDFTDERSQIHSPPTRMVDGHCDSSLSVLTKFPLLPNDGADDFGCRADGNVDSDLEDVKTPDGSFQEASTVINCADQSSFTPGDVKSAVLRGDFETVKCAFDKQYSGKLETVDPTGMVLLMVAAQKGYDDIVDLLVSHGSCVNAQQKNGTTALMLACEQGHLSTAMFLVEMGASINLQQTSGETALMKAVRRGRLDVTKFLLYKGANYHMRTLNGNSALLLSKHLGDANLESLLTEHRERVNTEFTSQVTQALKDTANLLGAIFPIQCFPLSDGPRFVVAFNHDLESEEPGFGYLLFIGHARMSEFEMSCRFYGPCAITAVTLNQIDQYPVSQDCGFVLSCVPLKDGRNEIVITTVTAPSSKTKLLVCAYKAELVDH